MFYRLVIVCLAGLAWFGCDTISRTEAIGCSLDPEPDEADYFPMTVGNKWYYNFEADSTTWWLGQYYRDRRIGQVSWEVLNLEDCIDGVEKYVIESRFGGRRESWSYDTQEWIAKDSLHETSRFFVFTDSLIRVDAIMTESIRRYWPNVSVDSLYVSRFQSGLPPGELTLVKGVGMVRFGEWNHRLGGFSWENRMELTKYEIN